MTQPMVGGSHSEATTSRVGMHLLQYLHQVTEASWTLSATPMGTSFPIVTTEGHALGFLCMATNANPIRYQRLGEQMADALAILVETETRDLPRRNLGPSGWGSEIDEVDQRLIAYFQPIVELRTGDVVAVEALARLQTTDGVLGPEAFLSSFTTTRSMLGLFDRMLESALAFQAEFRHRMPDLSAAVNLEFAAVPEMGLAELVGRRIDEFGADGDTLTIELNERLAYQLTDSARDQLAGVADLGVKLLLDDIPSSFHALEQLAGVPVSGAKLDRRFVKQLLAGEREADEVREILARSADAGIELIAEGVETQGQCDRLVQLGCRFGQGYLFAVPQPASSLAVVLDAPLVGSW
jgi:EAL domain-containing protein (putative c-di-GMP-specific phosphodiesterase class I)